MRVLAIDPGKHVGLVIYDDQLRAVERSAPERGGDHATLATAHRWLHDYAATVDVVAIERVQAGAQVSSDLIRTAEDVGDLRRAAHFYGARRVMLLTRREVIGNGGLHATGPGTRDTLVRQRLIEMHGGTKEDAVGTAKARGPLFGVVKDAWAALAVAVVAAQLVQAEES